MTDTKKEIEQKVRNICTYHSEDPLGGTSGYDLREGQFQEIFALIAKEREEAVRETAKEIYDMAEALLMAEVMRTQISTGKVFLLRQIKTNYLKEKEGQL